MVARNTKSAFVSKPGRTAGVVSVEADATVALRIADRMGLLAGPKTKQFTAKVSPKLFEAAAKRVGSSSPAVVINAALAALATEDDVGPWLARNWGILSDLPPDVLDDIEI
jgi:hypothetical protein